MARKITHYKHPSEPALQQREDASKMDVMEILNHVFRYQAWHRKVFGPSEKDLLTQGRKVVVWKNGKPETSADRGFFSESGMPEPGK